MPSARSRSVVGVTQTLVLLSPSRAMSSSVRCVAWTTVVPGPSRPSSCSSRVGVTPYAARQASFSATCSERWTCSGSRPLKALQLVARHGPHRVDRRRAGAGPLGPPLGGAVAVADLHALGRRTEAAAQVARVQQGHPDAGLLGGDLNGPPHRVRVVVRRPVGPVVQVVELPHARVAGRDHLAVRRAGQRAVRFRLEPARDVVHLLPPRPERPALPLGPAPERAVERVAVVVRQAGDREAGQPGGSFTGYPVKLLLPAER